MGSVKIRLGGTMRAVIGALAIMCATGTVRADDPPADLNVVQQTSTNASAGAGGSSIASAGTFAEPPLVPVKRPDFGSKAAKVQTLPEPKLDEKKSPVTVWGFSAAAGICMLLTLLVGLSLSKMTDASGATRRTLTVGTKLSLAFGSVTTFMLALAALGANSTHVVLAITAEDENLATKERVLTNMSDEVANLRLAANRFLVNPTNDQLVMLTDTLGKFKSIEAQAEAFSNDTEINTIAREISDAVAQYEAAFTKVVGEIDAGEAILSSQLNIAAGKAESLFDGIINRAVAKGDSAMAFDVAKAKEQFQSVRISVLKFVNDSNPEHITRATADAGIARTQVLAASDKARDPQVKAALSEIAAAVGFYAGRVPALVGHANTREDTIKNGMNKLGPAVAALGDRMKTLMADRSRELHDRAQSASAAAVAKSIGIAALAMLISVVVGVLLVRNISGSVRKVLTVLQSVANNDLMQQPINSAAKDELGELGRATDKMAASLRDVITEVSISTTEVSSAATEIAASAEEMSASVGEVARQCAQAAESAGSAGKMATEGGEVVRQTVSGMQEIDQAVQASAQSVSLLGERGQQIGQVIKVINDIADQTNLLALNAAIEAARAGEHGRGFAVVADEVRKLAERTTKATEEVASSIKSIQDETRQAVERMGRGTEQVKSGVALAEQAGQNLNQIVEGSTGVAGMIQSISSAAEEAGAGATQSASAAVELSAKAEQLMSMVGRFKLDTSGVMRNAAIGTGKSKKKASAAAH